LKYLTDYYKNDLRLALAAYNAVRARWTSTNGSALCGNTNYVYQVGKRLGDAKRRASIQPSNQSGPAVPVAKPAADKIVETKPVEPVYPKIQQYVDPEGRLHLRTRKTTL